MTSADTALLFTPPLPPLALPEDATIVLGRSTSCDLRLPDADTSRRHAKIVCAGGRYVLHDLASTNGTRVNGEPVDQQELVPGDRITIGGNQITFCRVESDLADGSVGDGEAQTVLMERPRSGDVFRGDLQEIPPFAVLQILEMGHKHGVLTIEGDTTGRLWFAAGDPVHAETKDQVGFDAALAIVNAVAGRFTFEPSLDLPSTTIEATVTQLLLEASRHLDEDLL